MRNLILNLGKVLEKGEQYKIKGGYHDDGINGGEGGCFPEEVLTIIKI